MPRINTTGPSARAAAVSGEDGQSTPANGESGRGRRKIIRRGLFGLYLALLGGALAILWPLLKMAGTALAMGMVAAVLVLSLTPLLLLHSTLRRTRASSHHSEKGERR